MSLDYVKFTPGFEQFMPKEYRDMVEHGPFGKKATISQMGSFKEILEEHPMCAGCAMTLFLGSEFMPTLNEGTLLYMPASLPGMSVTKAAELLQTQNKIIKSFPEVESVWGKAGRASTATDPAPTEMFETVINLKPEHQWRAGMTIDRLVAEMDRSLQFPGVSNAWTMPIK